MCVSVKVHSFLTPPVLLASLIDAFKVSSKVFNSFSRQAGASSHLVLVERLIMCTSYLQNAVLNMGGGCVVCFSTDNVVG